MFFMVFAAGMAAFRNETVLCLRLSRELARWCKAESAGQGAHRALPSQRCFYGFCVFKIKKPYIVSTGTGTDDELTVNNGNVNGNGNYFVFYVLCSMFCV